MIFLSICEAKSVKITKLYIRRKHQKTESNIVYFNEKLIIHTAFQLALFNGPSNSHFFFGFNPGGKACIGGGGGDNAPIIGGAGGPIPGIGGGGGPPIPGIGGGGGPFIPGIGGGGGGGGPPPGRGGGNGGNDPPIPGIGGGGGHTAVLYMYI